MVSTPVQVSFVHPRPPPPAAAGLAIRSSYAGFSEEWIDTTTHNPMWMTANWKEPHPVAVRLIGNLIDASGGDGFNVRIGGNSANKIWWNPNHATTPNPAGSSIAINATVLGFYAQLAKSVPGLRYTFGVSMRVPPAAGLDATQVFVRDGIYGGVISASNIDAIEVGNEPEDYVAIGYRAASYSAGKAASEVATEAGFIQGAMKKSPQFAAQGTRPFAGPSSNSFTFTSTFVTSSAMMSATKYITAHNYAQSVCPGAHTTPSASGLLAATDDTTFSRFTSLLPRAAGVPLLLGETNSVSCGGALGVSNTFASTLWSLDHLATSAWSGIQGARFHAGVYATSTPFDAATGTFVSQSYAAFVLSNLAPNLVDVRPLYYGMLAFTRAVGWVGRSGVTVDNGALSAADDQADGNVRYFAFSSKACGRGSVLIINKNEASSAKVVVKFVPPASVNLGVKTARVERVLSTGGVGATRGISIAGQTFDGSCDGAPIGVWKPETVTLSGGAFKVTVAPLSAVVVYMGPGSNKAAFNTTPGRPCR
ncbi:hypothetical protein HK101_009184 [Irineochytrium annulatum]|nr:hypothetical protein HK101_009184 [Irineochytrium annulatum]